MEFCAWNDLLYPLPRIISFLSMLYTMIRPVVQTDHAGTLLMTGPDISVLISSYRIECVHYILLNGLGSSWNSWSLKHRWHSVMKPSNMTLAMGHSSRCRSHRLFCNHKTYPSSIMGSLVYGWSSVLHHWMFIQEKCPIGTFSWSFSDLVRFLLSLQGCLPSATISDLYMNH